MTNDHRPTPSSLGFRPVARFGTRAQLTDAGRKRTGGDDGKRIAYIVHDDAASAALFASRAPATYMWVETGSGQPCYVGKASLGMKKRAGEHEGGFHGTARARAERERRRADGDARDVTAGFGHARRIHAMWESSNGRHDLELWVRPADQVEIFGSTVSLAAAEEERLIALFQPRWNREHKLEEPDEA